MGGVASDATVAALSDEFEKAASARRLNYIRMNPASLSRLILPGGHSVLKTNTKTGVTRKVYAERLLGYFWMMKDLREAGNKPILSNEVLVEANESMRMPSLSGCQTLMDDNSGENDGTSVNLPDWFLRNNRSRDATAQCTLVGISYKEFGRKMLSSWIDPFREALCDNSDEPTLRGRYSVATLSINEGRVLSWLSGFIRRSAKSNTPPQLHGESLLYFGEDPSEFRDALRMHNTLTGYVYLLDGIGRVRWAGSGVATEAEAMDMVGFAKELVPGGVRQTAKQIPSSKKERRSALTRRKGRGSRITS